MPHFLWYWLALVGAVVVLLSLVHALGWCDNHESEEF